MVTIGIDPHKRSLTALALDEVGHELGRLRLAADGQSANALRRWAAGWPERRFGVEGACGLGRGVAQALLAAGEAVFDVPAALAARARLLDTGSARKSDAADAASVAAVLLRQRRPRAVAAEDHTTLLRLLSDRRDELVAERTRLLNRLHRLLADLLPGGAAGGLSSRRAAELLRRIRPVGAVAAERKRLAWELVGDLRRLDSRLDESERALAEAVAATATTLTELHGIGWVLAAKILAHSGSVRRFPSRHHYASYTGTAPIEASSGDIRRHRLSRAGNRQLNSALHTMAVCQIRDPGPGQDHYRRKLAEAKTPSEARRSLKRQLANVVYRRLVDDETSRLADSP